MWPISSTTSVAVSRSIGWLMVAITPMLSMVLMTSVAFTAIFCAISCGVMVSPMVTSRLMGAVGISNAWRDSTLTLPAAGAFLDALLLLVARAGAAGDMQLLASVTRVLGRIGSRPRAPSRACGARGARGRGRDFGGGTALRFGFLLGALLFLRAAGFFRLLLLGGFVFDAPAVLRLHALAFLARGFLALALGGFLRFLFLALLVGGALRLLVLLFENVALDVGFLVANFDVHRARATLRARLLELALRLARQRDLARRGGAGGLAGLGGAMRAAQVREQLELGLVADQRLGACDLDSRGLELHEQPVDRNLQDFGKLCNGDIGHKFSSGATGFEPDLASLHDELAGLFGRQPFDV